MPSQSSLNQTPDLSDFHLPFGGKLDPQNRWIKLADLMPWEVIEHCYAQSLSEGSMGAPAKSGRMAYGAQIIKERLGVSDEEVVAQIMENPYLQIFLGFTEFSQAPPFDSSLMVYFRKRFTEDHHRQINEEIIPTKNDSEEEPPTHSGKLLIDATCTPADIKYPTDISLLNDAREKTEGIVDIFHKEIVKRTQDEASAKKPRTYRQKAREGYLKISMAKRVSKSKRRAEIRRQLSYINRNRASISKMLENHSDYWADVRLANTDDAMRDAVTFILMHLELLLIEGSNH